MNKSFIAAIIGTLLFFILAIGVPLMFDATHAEITNIGTQHKITLYSGGTKIGQWYSTGSPTVPDKIGCSFIEYKTNTLIYIRGDIIIETIAGTAQH